MKASYIFNIAKTMLKQNAEIAFAYKDKDIIKEGMNTINDFVKLLVANSKDQIIYDEFVDSTEMIEKLNKIKTFYIEHLTEDINHHGHSDIDSLIL